MNLSLYERVGELPWRCAMGLGSRRGIRTAALRDRALAFIAREGAIRHGENYIIVAEPI